MGRFLSILLLCMTTYVIWMDIRERMDCHAGRADACAAIDRQRANAALSRSLRGQP